MRKLYSELSIVILLFWILILFLEIAVQGSGVAYVGSGDSIDPPLASLATGALKASELVPRLDTFVTVLESNTSGWGGPFVFYEAGLYKMWYGTGSSIVYAESGDGVTWSVIHTFHNCGGYYRAGSPWIIKEDAVYRMWHMDYYENVAGDWSGYIAHMNSTDSVTWPAFMSADEQKVLSAQGQSAPQGDGYHVAHACVLHETAEYAMWYSVCDLPQAGTGGRIKIWRATSTDGIAWSSKQLSLPYVLDTWEDNVRHASVTKESDGTYTMFYWAHPMGTHNGSSIGIAGSTDGITWTDRRQLLKPYDLNPDIVYLCDPFHFQDTDGKRYLYFAYYDGQHKFGRIQLTILGDVNGDRIVDITDISLVIAAYGKTSASPGWSEPPWYANRDLNDDDIIDITDISLVISQYGNYW